MSEFFLWRVKSNGSGFPGSDMGTHMRENDRIDVFLLAFNSSFFLNCTCRYFFFFWDQRNLGSMDVQLSMPLSLDSSRGNPGIRIVRQSLFKE